MNRQVGGGLNNLSRMLSETFLIQLVRSVVPSSISRSKKERSGYQLQVQLKSFSFRGLDWRLALLRKKVISHREQP